MFDDNNNNNFSLVNITYRGLSYFNSRFSLIKTLFV